MSATMPNQRTRNRGRQQPSTGRGGYPSYKRETSEPETSNTSPIRGLYRDHRTAMMMCSFMGSRTSVKTRNGSTYKGHAVGFSHMGDIALTDAKLDDEESNQNPSLPGLIIPKDTFVVCKTNGVDLKGLCSSLTDFTDSGIVGRMNGNGESTMKELQPWHDEDALDVNSSLSLDDANEGWDSHSMFQANRDKFNVQSTYNEDLLEYTTKLPDPASVGYEERQKFAQKHADEIEQSEAYQNRISKELVDGDEEALFSAVHRGSDASLSHRLQESNNGGGKVYTSPALRQDSDQGMKNGSLKGQGRGMRHYSPTSNHVQPHHQQQQHHQNVSQSTRQINNHYQGPPPPGGSVNRNQGPGSIHSRQHGPQNHAAPSHSHHQPHPAQQYQQQPPPPHPGMHPHQPPVSQQQQMPPPHPGMHPHQPPVSQQLASPSSQHPNKPHPHPQNGPPTLSSPSQPPPQPQHAPLPQRVSPPHSQIPGQQATLSRSSSINGTAGPPQASHPYRQISTENKAVADVLVQKVPPMDIHQQTYHQKPTTVHQSLPVATGVQGLPASSPSSGSLVDVQQMGPLPGSVSGTSPPSVLSERRLDTNPEERNKIGQSLHDFKRNFVLESNGGNPPESARPGDTPDNTPVSSTPASSSAVTTPISSAPDMVVQFTEQAAEVALRRADNIEEELQVASKSKLNPNAKEFKPKAQPAPMEAQSPSPQPRSSPHMPQMVHYPPQQTQTVLLPYPYIMTNQLNPQRKRATVSLGAGDLTAHQVTGQPLLATQPPSMMYIQAANQPLPAGYQFYSPQIINPRMVAPGSLTMAQASQVTGLDQATAQNQPQPVFMTAQQSVPAPMPAHLHHQAHTQAMPHHTSNQQQIQPAHIPNPAPSPVQQHNSQPLPQQLSHHMSQGPSQSATPQPTHYPQMNYTHGIPAVPRTVMSGQPNMAGGHTTMSFMSGPQFAYNGGTAQYAFAPAPQTPQSSSHGSGPQTHQYVMMPQPNPQSHPSIQQHQGQPYATTGIPYQSQQLMQGPPQMPPNHNQNPNQGSPHLMHPGMPAGLHQQVSGGQPGMYMQVPSGLQYHQQ